MKSLQALQKEIIDEFQHLPDIDAKYSHLFELGDQLPPMKPELKTDRNLVRGCQSALWFYMKEDKGRIYLEADSDSMVIKGIAALLIRLIQGRKKEELAKINLDFIDEIGIWKLASGRNNGLMAMLDYIHREAKVKGEEDRPTMISAQSS